MSPPAHWQLPPGVSSGVWQYAQSSDIAEAYDEYFALHPLFEIDEQAVSDRIQPPGVVLDLGCGTGRALLPLAERGLTCVGVDLSIEMLRVLGEKAANKAVRVHRVCANLVEMSCFPSGSADYCLCLFSTLGMVQGRNHRARVLAHVHRILRPDGLFIVHVHNLLANLLIGAGRRWLAGHLLRAAVDRNVELGDKFFDYRGVPRMYLHTFRRRELSHALRQAGFRIEELIWLAPGCTKKLRWPWLLGSIRANGWIAICRALGDRN